MNDSATAVVFQWETVREKLFQSNGTTYTETNNTNNNSLLDNDSNTTNNSATFTTSRTGPDTSLIISGFMFAIVIFLTCLLCYLLLPMFLRWVKSKIPVSAAHINRRYDTVEWWLITKRVKAHCRVCEIVQRAYGVSRSSAPPPNIRLTASHETAEMTLQDDQAAEEEGQSCSICMEAFQHNELVSWSPMTECDHVFHHACIKTWLLHHECCPYCRGCMLSVDHRHQQSRRGWVLRRTKHDRNRDKEQIKELSWQRQKRSLTTYFCIKEGLITLDQSKIDKANAENPVNLIPERKTTGAGNAAKGFFSSDMVRPHEMMALRTHPKSIRSTTDVLVTITSPSSQTLQETTADTNAVDDVDDATVANAVIDIETTMNELPVISDDVADANDTV